MTLSYVDRGVADVPLSLVGLKYPCLYIVKHATEARLVSSDKLVFDELQDTSTPVADLDLVPPIEVKTEVVDAKC